MTVKSTSKLAYPCKARWVVPAQTCERRPIRAVPFGQSANEGAATKDSIIRKIMWVFNLKVR